MPRGYGEQDPDDFVLHETQPFGATPAMAVLQQQRLRDGTGRGQFGLQKLGRRGAEDILTPGMLDGERIHRCGDPFGIETFIGLGTALCHDVVHDQTGYRTAGGLSREIWDNSRSMLDFPPCAKGLFFERAPRGGYFLVDLIT
jgi:hypothetical protein